MFSILDFSNCFLYFHELKTSCMGTSYFDLLTTSTRTISIDLGSETTRCAISLKVSDHNNETRERPIRPFDGGRHDRMDYSSLCNLTGSIEDEPYVGNDDTKNDSAVTIKLAIILITGAKDDGLSDTPMMRVLNEIEKNGDVKIAKKRAKRALNTLLTRISARAKVVCDRDSCYISALGFSVPEQWSQSAHIYMENAIRSAFGLPADFQIMVLHEIDSNAQYYLDEEMARDTVLDGMKEQVNSLMLQNTLILFVDAGGFSMVCSHPQDLLFEPSLTQGVPRTHAFTTFLRRRLATRRSSSTCPWTPRLVRSQSDQKGIIETDIN